MDTRIALIATAVLFAMFALHVVPLVGLTVGNRQLPTWLAVFQVSAGGFRRIAAITWAAVLAALSQVAVIAGLLRPSVDGPARLLFMAELVLAAALTYWLLARRSAS